MCYDLDWCLSPQFWPFLEFATLICAYIFCFYILSINSLSSIQQANVGQTWLADENILTHFESLKLETDEKVSSLDQ